MNHFSNLLRSCWTDFDVASYTALGEDLAVDSCDVARA